MAEFYPTLEEVRNFKVPPTEGERTLLDFLANVLDDSFEVYFNPYLNGDRPDVIVMRKDYGVLVIEVKDWDLSNFRLDERKKWIFRDGSVVKSPIDQVLKYKNNLFDLHVDKLLEKKINDFRHFNVVSCSLYFHCVTQEELTAMLVKPFADDKKYQTFLKYNIDLIGRDSLEPDSFEKLLCKRYLKANKPSFLFTQDIYDSFKRLLSPSIHLREQGTGYRYSPKQHEIIYSTTLEQRVKGVFGSGKTTVLAARAVQAYKRALSRTNNPRILILTFNITLKNFIHDKLKQVQETFQEECFIIVNYHTFINAEFNNLGIEFEIPEDIVKRHIEDIIDRCCRSNPSLFEKYKGQIKKYIEQLIYDYFEKYYDSNISHFEGHKKQIPKYDAVFVNEIQGYKRQLMDIIKKCIKQYISDYLDSNYYSSLSLFEKYKEQIKKYDAVFIDEIQDYKRQWMDIIKTYFRSQEGDYVLFGDVKQNIYGQPTQQKDVVTNVQARPIELKYCYRSDFKVRDLAQSFQRGIFKDKYDVDDFSENDTIGSLGLTIEKEGYINYIYLPEADTITALYNIIRGNILNKANNISPNDITILGYTINELRDFDCYYRYACREKTATMMETIEVMYMTHLNFIGKNEIENIAWFDNICSHLKKKLFSNRDKLSNNDIIKLRKHIAKLFTLYRLYTSYKDVFINRFKEECETCGISMEAYCAWYKHYEQDLTDFNKQVFDYDYKFIRDNKKLHFWMNSGTIKISTINSFKGWESEVVFLIIEPKYDNYTVFNRNFDELLYTGLTRTRRNLIVINFGNKEYDDKMRPLIEALK